jgi:hypothetical protein
MWWPPRVREMAAGFVAKNQISLMVFIKARATPILWSASRKSSET